MHLNLVSMTTFDAAFAEAERVELVFVAPLLKPEVHHQAC